MNFKKSTRNFNLILLLATCLFLSGFIIFAVRKVEKQTSSISKEIKSLKTMAKVTKVFDGDTIQIENGQKVRYIGIDSPETYPSQECYSKESKEANEALVLNKEVVLVTDISNTDKYGRLLRYVYVNDVNNNDIFVNEFLIRNGFAKVATYPPDIKFKNIFNESQQKSLKNYLGLWASCKN